MKKTIALTKELINCASLTPDDAGCQTIIEKRLKTSGFKCESMRFGEVDNLYARLGTASPLVLFAGHTDVVPTGDEKSWDSPPFEATIQDEKIIGRGVVDMKGAIAAMIVACESFLEKNKTFAGSIGFLITSDEEGPSIDGTAKVVDALIKRGEKIAYCIIGEPSSKNKIGDQIRVGRRGSLHGKLTVQGKLGHVAHPHLADNAIHKSLETLHQLTQEKWDAGNSHFPPTSFQITNIKSGAGALNVIPAMLEADFNFRFSTASTVESLKTKTETILNAAHKDHDIQWTVGAEPFLTKQGRLMQAASEVIQSRCGYAPEFNCGGGTSDGRFISKTGAEIIEIGCLHHTAHQVNECETLQNLTLLTEIYTDLLKALLC